MGANASNYPHSCSPRVGGNSQAQQTFIGTSSYSQQGYGCESKLYSLDHGHEKPQDKKKRTSGLATLKKKFIKRRKSNRSADHAKQMRELLSGWDVRDVNALVEEYEGTSALKELSLQASLARPEARTLQKDMADLYEYKYCTDVDLIFQETCFPVHRAILAARCPFFKTLLSSSPEYGAEIIMDISTAGIDMPMFSALLHYLYTGEFGMEDSRFQNVDILVQLSEEFGTPNSLDVDMRGLFDYMCYYDVVLSFSSDSELVEAFGGNQNCLDEELKAHKAIISARSPFFRNLLQRRIRTGEEITDRTLRTPTRIILDESIIPKKYAKVILHCMYTDVVDLSVLHCSPSVGSLSEVQALVAGKPNMTRAEEAMELYHIALFLEFNMLAQGCEDIIAESISLETLIAILKWSSHPYGSKWVHRQALHFLCEELSQVMTSDVFYELSKDHLLTAIQSDYLQASEQDILKYLIKWGEHQLMKRIADREPNLLSGTAHSVNKRGVKRRDLDMEELREILSSLLPFVRIEHILPMNSEVLSDAMKRGLISTPPSDMLPTTEGGKSNAWLRQKNAGIYVRPRLFSPYVEEAKSVLDEMMVEQTDLVRLRMVRMSNVPDTLYMVSNAMPQCCHMISHQQISSNQSSPPSVVANEIPVPRLLIMKDMVRRLQELRHTEQVQRAYALNCGEGATVSYEIQIRVLREFGLADAAAELLQCPQPVLNDLMPDIAMGVSTLSLKDRRLPELAADTELCQTVSEAGPGPPQHLSCIPQRHTHTSRKKHTLEQKPDGRESQQEYPDLYDFPNAACRPSTPAPGRRTPSPSRGRYFGPDLYSHNKASPNGLKSAYLPGQTSPKKQEDTRREYPLSPDGHPHKQKNEPIRLDVVEQPPQRPDFPSAASENASNGPAHVRARTAVETDLTFGLTPNRPPSHSACSSEVLEERSSRRLTDSESLGHGAQRNADLERDDSISRGRRSPSKPDFLYKKSAL
ncbi:BTB (POZ) domain containing 7 (predicted) [Rattus norvegicus]|uniref:BTB/POZ domain-containing protein 7 n=2 Tax=Rattus norvegicus TaxID=10116 RepID=D3ZCW2_RAT|nr:BTB/POZ domain-containing protein 7 [Rattus norvegicus]EDL81761.1 BTB (POZ) domain containing 7 (predicted) [Rattus norvegicus]|eukprot:NP_001102190.1 BTB/POZ domain-containing protein 7 [Rattus norvegicus]